MTISLDSTFNSELNSSQFSVPENDNEPDKPVEEGSLEHQYKQFLDAYASLQIRVKVNIN